MVPNSTSYVNVPLPPWVMLTFELHGTIGIGGAGGALLLVGVNDGSGVLVVVFVGVLVGVTVLVGVIDLVGVLVGSGVFVGVLVTDIEGV